MDATDIYKKSYEHAPLNARVKRRTSISTARQLVEIRRELRKKRERIYRRASLVVIGLLMTFTFTTYEVTSSIDRKKNVEKNLIEDVPLSQKIRLYDFHMRGGKEAARNFDWDSSIDQYNRALDIAPGDLFATENLACAICLQCLDERVNCEMAELGVAQLKTIDPDHPKIKIMKSILRSRD